MGRLEDLVDINAAIMTQKNSLFKIIEGIFKEKGGFHGSAAEAKGADGGKNIQSKQSKGLYKKIGDFAYKPFKILGSYASEMKSKLYDYYSKARSNFDKAKRGIGYKLLTEIEDWGVIYFKTAFKKMERLSPLGQMQRYLEKLWICVSKKVK
jgi:hypothetical protein